MSAAAHRFELPALMAGLALICVCSASHGQGTSKLVPVDTEGPTSLLAIDLDQLDGFPASLQAGVALSSGTEIASPLTEALPLSEAATQALLQRLDPLPAQADEQNAFALRASIQPPPRAGAIVQAAFPPVAERARPTVSADRDKGFKVLRYAPEGEVGAAAQIGITFDRPMIAAGSQDDSKASVIPISLTPSASGTWRWIGTRVLIFEPAATGLAMATEYTVALDPQARAADGSSSAQAISWQFRTPGPVLQSHYSGTALQPLIVLVFDQRVEPETVLPLLSLETPKRQSLPSLVLASTTDVAAESALLAHLASVEEARKVYLRPTTPLPQSTQVDVVIAAGVPSAEGPRRSVAESRFSFHTYGEFKFEQQKCGAPNTCGPNDSFGLQLSNPVAPDQDLNALVRIDPAFPDAIIRSASGSLTVDGFKPGGRSYTVEISPDLTDIHGQQLSGVRLFRYDVRADETVPQALLFAPGNGLITIDPNGPARLVFQSVNLTQVELTVHRVRPEDWPGYNAFINRYSGAPSVVPGKEVANRMLQLNAKQNEPTRTVVDLRPWLDGDVGHLLIRLKPIAAVAPAIVTPSYSDTWTWLQVTRIGLDAVVDSTHLHAWATRLEDGKPLAGVSLQLPPDGKVVKTNAGGLARLALLQPRTNNEPGVSNRVIATLGKDSAFLTVGMNQLPMKDALRWFVFDDRGLYKTGETVHLKGWLRLAEMGVGGGLALPKTTGPIRYTVADSRGNQMAEGEAVIGELGGFDLSFTVPSNANLGPAAIELHVNVPGIDQTPYRHAFKLQAFRTPDFVASTEFTNPTVFVGDRLELRTSAQYYAGGALPGARVSGTLSATPANYQPPNQPDYSFGTSYRLRGAPSMASVFSGLTDAAGLYTVGLLLDRYALPRPLTLAVTSNVQDLTNQTLAATTSTLVHPAAVYVGMKTEGYFVDQGKPMAVDLIAVNLAGEPAADRPLQVEAGRLEWVSRSGSNEQLLRDVQRCDTRSGAGGLAHCEFKTEHGGQYQITAVTTDVQGRRNATRIERWVSGARLPEVVDRLRMGTLQLLPDRDQYGPDDVARILIQAPFENGHGLVTISRHGVLEQRQFRLEGSSHTLEIPIRREWLPNVELAVMVVGQVPRDATNPSAKNQRPVQAVGTIRLKLSTAERRLNVGVKPEQGAVAPGQRTRVVLSVRDAADRPLAGAEVALIVVDESILTLGRYQLADPIDLFYPLSPEILRLHHLRPTVRLNPETVVLDAAGLQQLRAVATQNSGPPPMPSVPAPQPSEAAPEGSAIAMRSDFNPLAAFVPALRTDSRGTAVAEFTLPDTLTRYRIMAVAVSGATLFGVGEAQLTAHLPLTVRASPPRFLNFGDRFSFSVMLQNTTDVPMSVQVALQTRNLQQSGPRGYAVAVPAKGRVQVHFAVAAQDAGTAHYQVAVATDGFSDAVRGQLSVWTPASTETFATYGVIDTGAVKQPISLPSDVWPQVGGLSLTTSSTALQSLTDAFLYLHQYPFDSTEQIASRIIATVALRDVLQSFEVDGLPTPEAIAASVAQDIDLLLSRQNQSGNFSTWRRSEEELSYFSLHAVHALVRARDKGYAVAPEALQRGLAFASHIDVQSAEYSPPIRRHLLAYALYVRALADDRDTSKARDLLIEAGKLDQLTFESLGWLLSVLSGDPASTEQVAQIRRFLLNHAAETAASAGFAYPDREDDYLVLRSDRVANAVVLDSMLRDQPESDLIPKLVHGLLASRVKGRWANTQENAFVLLALDRYFAQFEAITPDFVARAWLGNDFAGEHQFRSRSTERQQISVPMQWLSERAAAQSWLISKGGPGRLYYRIALDYSPRSLLLTPAEHGFAVERSYKALDDPADVRRLPDGRYEIRAGARVGVEITMVATGPRHHVALVDPLPAGLEAINPDLSPSQVDPQRGLNWWMSRWYGFQNLRDDRVEAFSTELDGGVYTFRYQARAITPGEYVVPPAKAEEMYEPETFGRSGTDRVVVH